MPAAAGLAGAGVAGVEGVVEGDGEPDVPEEPVDPVPPGMVVGTEVGAVGSEGSGKPRRPPPPEDPVEDPGVEDPVPVMGARGDPGPVMGARRDPTPESNPESDPLPEEPSGATAAVRTIVRGMVERCEAGEGDRVKEVNAAEGDALECAQAAMVPDEELTGAAASFAAGAGAAAGWPAGGSRFGQADAA